jgi:SAM-dependent methyltransferase
VSASRVIDPALPAMGVEDAYDLAAPYYDDWKWQEFWHRTEYPLVRSILERFRRGRSQGLDLLDVGCGTGWYIQGLAPLLSAATGIDLSAGMLAIARYRLPGLPLLKEDARSLPFRADRFDAVLCTRVLSHVPDFRPVLREMCRVLVPGGILVVSNVDASHDYEHTRLPVGARRVLADTFKHDRDRILDAAGDLRLVATAPHVILADGTTVEAKRRRPPSGPQLPVGWVASWRRGSNPPG